MQDPGEIHGNLITELEKLQSRNRALEKMVSDLSEAAKNARNEQMSWVYAMEGNRDGVWDWNSVTNEVFFSTRWKEMLGYGEDDIANQFSEWDERLHPEDREAAYADLNAHLQGKTLFYHNEHRLRCKDGSYKWILDRGKIISRTEDGKPLRIVGTHTDISDRKTTELENARLFKELKTALEEVKKLSGLLPICSSCKKIRDDRGYWNQIENYISEHADVGFSHGICPECAAKLYPEFDIYEKADNI